MKKSKGFIHNTLILFISITVSRLISAVLKIPLTNILGGIGMGYFSAAYSIFSPLYALTAVALPITITKLVAQNVAHKNFKNVRRIKTVSLYASVAMGIIGTGIMLLFATPFSQYIANSKNSYLSILLIAPSLLFCCIAAVYKGYYEGLLDMIPTAISHIVEAVVKSVVGLSLAFFALRRSMEYYGNIEEALPIAAAAAVLGVTISEFSGTIFLIIMHKIRGDGIAKVDLQNSPKADKKILKLLLAETIPLAIGAVVINLTSFIDLLTIPGCINYGIEHNVSYFLNNFTYGKTLSINPNMLGDFFYGSYNGIVLTIYMIIPSIASLIGKSALPRIATAWELKNTRELSYNIKVLFKGVAAVAMPLSFGIAILSQPILTLLYPTRFAEVNISIISLTLYGIFGVVIPLTAAAFNIFQAIGRTDLPIKLMMIALFIKFAGNLSLITIPEINIAGAAISTIISYLVIFLIAIRIIEKQVLPTFSITSIISKPLFSAIMCGASAFCCYYLLFKDFNIIISLLCSITISGIVYLLATLLLDKKMLIMFLNDKFNKQKSKHL